MFWFVEIISLKSRVCRLFDIQAAGEQLPNMFNQLFEFDWSIIIGLAWWNMSSLRRVSLGVDRSAVLFQKVWRQTRDESLWTFAFKPFRQLATEHIIYPPSAIADRTSKSHFKEPRFTAKTMPMTKINLIYLYIGTWYRWELGLIAVLRNKL